MPHHDDDDIRPVDPAHIGPQSDITDEDERVGYGRPPKRSQFAKGQSGNPAGRPKGSLNRATLRAMVATLWLDETMKIGEGGRERHIPCLEALLKKQAELAFKGDRKAIKDCLDVVFRMVGDVREAHRDEETTAEDLAILRTHDLDICDSAEPGTDVPCDDERGDRE
ncbi:DUF5681 domain-containing protein [Methylobacterium phyllosphaerae]